MSRVFTCFLPFLRKNEIFFESSEHENLTTTTGENMRLID